MSADRWAVRVFLRRAPGVAALLLVAGPRGWLAFAGLYAYFRVWDDRVDVPDRRDVPALLRAEQAARRSGARGLERDALAAALARIPALADVADAMWTTLERDAQRLPVAPSREARTARDSAIGSAYAQALWLCLGQTGEVPASLVHRATIATAVHGLRDLHEDLALGYVNVPDEVCRQRGLDVRRPSGPALEDWRRQQAATLASELQPVEGPVRVRWVFGAMTRRYRAVAQTLAQHGLQSSTSTFSAQSTAPGS